MRKRKKSIHGCLLFTLSFFLLLTGCGAGKKNVNQKEEELTKQVYTIVGFSQLGAESDWRNSHTESLKEALSRENGFDLVLDNGQQKQSNQIMAIRTFIQQEVDYIVLAPVTETGWDTALEEARDAGIPVIIVDRQVKVHDDSLYACRVGSDFKLEALKLTEWLNEFLTKSDISSEMVHIVDIQGTLGATAQIGRTEGLDAAAAAYGWDILAKVDGDFTQTKGKEVMKALLETYDNINIVYCENDNEALGAIEAITEAGKTPGLDIKNGEIMVLSFDGVNEEALNLVKQGKIACIAECNPLHGPLVRDIIAALQSGNTPEPVQYVEENTYACCDLISQITVNGKKYPVTVLQPEE